jgi:hypothetical protein
MRYFILLLLLANIVFFLLPKESQRTMHSYTRGAQNIPMLVMLGETDAPPKPLSQVPVGFSGVTLASTDSVAETPVQVVSLDDAPVAQQDETGQQEEAAPVDEADDVAQDHVKQEKTAEALAAIKDQGKFDKASEASGGYGIAAVQPPQTIVRGPLKCYTLGPFKDKKIVNDFTAKMVKKGVKPALRTAKARKASGYWVYLPSYPTRQRAREVADHLASIGFTDYFIVGEPKRNNAISLGLFSRKAGSLQRVRDLAEMGYKAKVETRFSEYEVYWIDYESYSEIDWTPLIREYKEEVEIENLDRECE